MNRFFAAILGMHTEGAPMRRGQPRTISSGRPRRGQAAAPLAFSGLKRTATGADAREDSWARGLTAITPAASETAGRPVRTRPPCYVRGGFEAQARRLWH